MKRIQSVPVEEERRARIRDEEGDGEDGAGDHHGRQGEEGRTGGPR